MLFLHHSWLRGWRGDAFFFASLVASWVEKGRFFFPSLAPSWAVGDAFFFPSLAPSWAVGDAFFFPSLAASWAVGDVWFAVSAQPWCAMRCCGGDVVSAVVVVWFLHWQCAADRVDSDVCSRQFLGGEGMLFLRITRAFPSGKGMLFLRITRAFLGCEGMLFSLHHPCLPGR